MTDEKLPLGEGIRPLARTLGESLRERLDRLFEQQHEMQVSKSPSVSTPFPPPLAVQTPTPASGSFSSAMQSKLTNNRFDCVPMADAVVRFDLLPLMSEFSQLVGLQAVGEAVEPAVKTLETDRERARALRDELDQDWLAYGMHGAAFVFTWADDVKYSIFSRHTALNQLPEVYVATDLSLVLNVLGRARGALLLAKAPLALERAFLVRSLATTDSRLVELARASAQTETIRLPELKK